MSKDGVISLDDIESYGAESAEELGFKFVSEEPKRVLDPETTRKLLNGASNGDASIGTISFDGSSALEDLRVINEFIESAEKLGLRKRLLSDIFEFLNGGIPSCAVSAFSATTSAGNRVFKLRLVGNLNSLLPQLSQTGSIVSFGINNPCLI